MPVLENVQVSLKEVLEVRGQPLGEWELWGVLFQTTMAVQDIFLRGQACKDGIPQYLVTPDNLLCSARGRVIVNVCFASKVKGTSYWCQELKDENFPSQSCILDKIYVFTIGQTILHAAHYGATEKNQKKFSPLLKTVFQAMCQTDTDLRMVLADIIEVCSLHAKKYMNGYTFVDAVKQLHHEVLGSLPESEILTQVDQDFTRDSYKDDAKGSNEDVTEVDYETKFLPYGERLGYHPEMSPNVKCHTKQVILTPKERWKEAYKKVLKEIQKSKVSLSNKEEVVSAWKAHKAHESIFRVYEELTERRKMLELLRLSINLDPVAPADMDQNPFLIAGLKPKTIAELVLLLQRPNKQNTLVSKSPVEVPKISDDTATNNFATSQMNIPSCSSIDDDSYERPFYDIDKIALNQPFSRNNSEFQSFSGPEFIINKIKPHIRIVPFCSDKEFHNSAFTVIVKLLTGEALDVECSSSVTGKQLYQAIADHLKLRERYLFGLAYMHGDEHIFIDKKQCMLDLLHSCSAIAKDKIQMHFRVKFYLNDIHLMRSPNLRHLYYLQLRKDLLDDDFHYDTTIALTLGGLALQSEFGNYDSLSHSKEYFLLEHYLSFTCIQQLNRNDAKAKLRDHHVNLQGVSKELAELKFIQGMMKSQEYGCHLHKVFQDKRNISSAVWLGIRSTGIEVYEKISGKRSLCQTYPWQNIKRISFCKKYFCIAPRTESYTGKHVVYRFYTSVLLRSQYLFNVAMAHHKFFLKLRTVSRASEIFIEDLDEEHHYFCDNSGVEKEIGCDLYDTKGKFQLKTKTLQHRSSSQNDLEFLNDPYTLDISQPKMDFQLKQTLGDSIEVQQKKILPKLVTRSSSAPDPVKRSHYASRHSSVKGRNNFIVGRDSVNGKKF